jgi:hypothetical protein
VYEKERQLQGCQFRITRLMSGGYPLYLTFILRDMRIMKRYSWPGGGGEEEMWSPRSSSQEIEIMKLEADVSSGKSQVFISM